VTTPVYEQCIDILEKVAMPEDVMRHVELVADMAVAFAESINRKHPTTVDVGLVRAGALLHDLGRVRTHTILHVVEGVNIAEELDLDPRVIEIIRRHVGGGLTPGDAKALGLPAWDGMPRSLEEKIVCHADSLVGPMGRRTLRQTLKYIRKTGSQIYELRVKQLHGFLSGLAEEDLDLIGPWEVL
jgi:uncharacterized protein